MSKTLIISSALFSLAIGSVHAADYVATDFSDPAATILPAVSGLNGKIEAGYVHYDFNAPLSADGYVVQGAVSAPLGQRFGLQVDAGYQNTTIDTSFFFPFDIKVDSGGVAGHLFWRDPSVGLLGAYAHYENHRFSATGGFGGSLEISNVRYGGEGEYYHNDWTAKAFIGADSVDFGGFFNQTYFTASGEVGFYINENALVFAGIDRSFEQTTGTVGLEALWDTGNQVAPTFYANATFGENTTSFRGGVRVMLGTSAKSLKRRHREDDPNIFLFNSFPQLGNCFANTSSPVIRMKREPGIHCSPREREREIFDIVTARE